ncbi:hypothetical protein [Streptomyces sp. ODS28]|uniref:hypothetical protein n=1 Tax=Streptomyces sp. ODS28 TaxID=3136688 RepID=UPI0031E57FFF
MTLPTQLAVSTSAETAADSLRPQRGVRPSRPRGGVPGRPDLGVLEGGRDEGWRWGGAGN